MHAKYFYANNLIPLKWCNAISSVIFADDCVRTKMPLYGFILVHTHAYMYICVYANVARTRTNGTVDKSLVEQQIYKSNVILHIM